MKKDWLLDRITLSKEERDYNMEHRPTGCVDCGAKPLVSKYRCGECHATATEQVLKYLREKTTTKLPTMEPVLRYDRYRHARQGLVGKKKVEY